jgi:hypothetical protein
LRVVGASLTPKLPPICLINKNIGEINDHPSECRILAL